jgi:outer membrane protein assembly factor BamB
MTGNGKLTCFTTDGKEVWKRDIQADYGKFGINHGYASTPLLHGERLYIEVLHGMRTDDPSYVFAVDKHTGRTLWKVERPTDARMESPDNYATPQMAIVSGKLQLVISGADYVTGHDPDTGQEVWRMGGFNPTNNPANRTIASSLVIGENVFTSSMRGRPFIAFRAGGSGNITGKNELWTNNLGADVPTPTTDGKYIYVLGDNGIMHCIEAATGNVVYQGQRIENGTYSASPLLADGKIYCISEDGTATVVKAGPAFEILGVSKLDSLTLASPVAVDNQLFIRTADHLYCIQQK